MNNREELQTMSTRVMVTKVVPQNLELHKKSSNNDNQLVKVSHFLNQ